MGFCKTIYKNKIVFLIDKKNVDDTLVQKIIFQNSTNKKIGLDMKNVESVNSPLLIKCLIENKIKLYNLQSELLTYFAIILKNGFLKSYMNFADFSENKRELVKRHFLVA